MDLKQIQQSLKNCPFCGGRPAVHKRIQYESLGEREVYRISCDCGVGTIWDSSLGNTMEIWNSRKGE